MDFEAAAKLLSISANEFADQKVSQIQIAAIADGAPMTVNVLLAVRAAIALGFSQGAIWAQDAYTKRLEESVLQHAQPANKRLA